ncbi:heparinase II/III family protein [Bdellovibrio bacteriovorus]|uniref:heparinase II/III domain-containing protein n=1 Tax=Bdellovibrio bacteriovorus TaxID=959 RepID=UPI0035A69878
MKKLLLCMSLFAGASLLQGCGEFVALVQQVDLASKQEFSIPDSRKVLVNDWASQMTLENAAKGVGVFPLRPEQDQIVMQNPPVFSWPLHRFKVAEQNILYTLEIRNSSGAIKSWTTATNWHIPHEIFLPGSYQWRVTGRGTADGGYDQQGAWRSFKIAENALPLFTTNKLAKVKTDSDWYSFLKQKAHPRLLSSERLKLLKPIILNQRKVAWAPLVALVKSTAEEAPPAPPILGSAETPTRTAWQLLITRVAKKEQDRIENAALVYRVLNNSAIPTEQADADIAFADMKARVFNLASWSTTEIDGQTADTDSAVRGLMWGLVLGYDNMYPRLSVSEREQLAQVIKVRADQMYERVHGPYLKLEHFPLDSHAVGCALSLSATLATMAGDTVNGVVLFPPEKVLRFMPFAFALIHPWGGSDGGWANSGAYGEWFMNENFQFFDALRDVTETNAYRSQQMQNYAHHRLYTVPGGNIGAQFGDGTLPSSGAISYYAYWLATRIPSEISAYFAYKMPLNGKHEALSRSLLSPEAEVPLVPAPSLASTSAVFFSTGEVSMLSDVLDDQRTNIQFRSSPFGSFNHGHADQNNFIIADKNKPLLINSGFYDYHLSEHAKAWYRLSKAKNVVTYDDGIGQRAVGEGLPTDYSAKGKIIGYFDGGNFTIATGDASEAYDRNTVIRAYRTLVYVKDNIILVHDDLLAKQPVRWEWNFHSLNRPAILKDGVQVVNEPAKLCLRQIAGDMFENYESTTGFPVNPATTFTNQYHSRWKKAVPTLSHHGVIMIDIGCQEAVLPKVSISSADHVITVEVKESVFKFSRGELPRVSSK